MVMFLLVQTGLIQHITKVATAIFNFGNGTSTITDLASKVHE